LKVNIFKKTATISLCFLAVEFLVLTVLIGVWVYAWIHAIEHIWSPLQQVITYAIPLILIIAIIFIVTKKHSLPFEKLRSRVFIGIGLFILGIGMQAALMCLLIDPADGFGSSQAQIISKDKADGNFSFLIYGQENLPIQCSEEIFEKIEIADEAEYNVEWHTYRFLGKTKAYAIEYSLETISWHWL